MSACKPTRLNRRDAEKARQYIHARVTVTGGGCWEWKLNKLHFGHGQAKWSGYPHKAHRLSYAAFCEEPGEMAVLHHCDNPPCCNPDHLFLGTKGDNNRDAAAKGRYALRAKRPPDSTPRGAEHVRAKVTGPIYEAFWQMRARGCLLKECCAALGISRTIATAINKGTHYSCALYGAQRAEAAE